MAVHPGLEFVPITQTFTLMMHFVEDPVLLTWYSASNWEFPGKQPKVLLLPRNGRDAIQGYTLPIFICQNKNQITWTIPAIKCVLKPKQFCRDCPCDLILFWQIKIGTVYPVIASRPLRGRSNTFGCYLGILNLMPLYHVSSTGSSTKCIIRVNVWSEWVQTPAPVERHCLVDGSNGV